MSARPSPTDPAPAAPPGRRGPVAASAPLHLAVLAALGIAAYATTFDVPLVLDDIENLARNPAVKSLSAWLAAEGWRSSRAVAYLTFALDGSLHGGSLAGLHATNLLVHLAAGGLLYALARALFRAPRLAGSVLAPLAPLVAFAAAALFLVHPLQTQAVTYVVQRMASLAGALYLASLACWLEARLATARAPRAAWLVASVAAFLLALFTKQSAATAVLALALLELACFEGPALRRAAWLVPHAAATVIGVALSLGGSGEAAAAAVEAAHLRAVPGRLEYALTQARVLAEYLGMLVVPVGQSLDHLPPVARSAAEPGVLLGLALLAAQVGGAAWLLATAARRDPAWRLVAVGLLFWLLAHGVESSLLPLADVKVEHRVYLPSAGIFLAVAVLLGLGTLRLARRSPRWVRLPAAAFAAALVGLGVATLDRNELWRDPVALWADAAAKAPENPRAQASLGFALLARHKASAAAEAFGAAIRLRPSDPRPYNGLARALAELGRAGEAEGIRREGMRLAAADQLALGRALLAAGAPRQAVSALEKAAWFAPGDAEVAEALARARREAADAGRPGVR
jgi:tetratricopeptide (TPR) repeat protein